MKPWYKNPTTLRLIAAGMQILGLLFIAVGIALMLCGS